MRRNYQPHQRGKRKYLTYSEGSLQLCMEAVEPAALPINKASEQYGIPRETTQNKLKNIHTESAGPLTVFSEVEEELFASRVVT